MWAGCGGGRSASARRGPQSKADSGGDLIKSLAESINHLEEFDSGQMLTQIRDRLNQWVSNEHPAVDWQRDKLLATLPEKLQELSDLKKLDAEEYSTSDAVFLQEAVWLRDVAKTTQAGQFDDVLLAERLFDWTVRNLQLQKDPVETTDSAGHQRHLLHGPRDILLMSRGTAEERSWVFVLLARQLGLDAVVLTLPQGEGKPRRVWLPALLHDKDLYLFDGRLGFPIPGPGGKGVATLAQAAADDSVLRALDLDETHPYPVKAEELKEIVPWIEASPGYLSKRMKLVESCLAGANHVVLSVNASALAKRLTELSQLAPATVWPLGYELLQQRVHVNKSMLQAMTAEMVVYQAQPKLAMGRTMQFKGRFDGPKGAKEAFMSARPSDIKMQDAKMSPDQRAVYEAAKQNASFWLGVIAFDEGNYPVAIDYFSKRTLEAAPDGPWTAAAAVQFGPSL